MKVIVSIVCLLFLHGYAHAQLSILRADGLPWGLLCIYDEEIELEGFPAGGTFSGCNVREINGKWYFNPIDMDRTPSTSFIDCELVYKLGNDSASRWLPFDNFKLYVDEDKAVCADTFRLWGDMLQIGSFNWYWTGPGIVGDSNTKHLKATLPVGSSGRYTFVATNSNTSCTYRDSVRVERKPLLSFRFTNRDTIWSIPGTPLELITAAERQYTIVGWEPVALFPDQTAASQHFSVDTPTIVRANAVTDDGCAEQAVVYINTWPVSVGESQSVAAGVHIYPNPVKQNLLVHMPVEGSVQLLDATGRLLIQRNLPSGASHIDVQSLAGGIYFARVLDQSGKHIRSLRLVKIKS